MIVGELRSFYRTGIPLSGDFAFIVGMGVGIEMLKNCLVAG